MADRTWRVRLAKESKRDLARIISWTTKHFGTVQAVVYRETLVSAVELLRDGPHHLSSRARGEIAPGVRTLHVARQGKPGSHILLYREAGPGVIEVIRILHDKMDFTRRLSGAPSGVIEDEEPLT